MTPKKPTAREAATEALSRLPKAEWTSGDSAFIRGFLEGWKAGAAIQRERDAEIAEQTKCKACGIQHDGDKFIYLQISEAIRTQGDEK